MKITGKYFSSFSNNDAYLIEPSSTGPDDVTTTYQLNFNNGHTQYVDVDTFHQVEVGDEIEFKTVITSINGTAQ